MSVQGFGVSQQRRLPLHTVKVPPESAGETEISHRLTIPQAALTGTPHQRARLSPPATPPPTPCFPNSFRKPFRKEINRKN